MLEHLLHVVIACLFLWELRAGIVKYQVMQCRLMIMVVQTKSIISRNLAEVKRRLLGKLFQEGFMEDDST